MKRVLAVLIFSVCMLFLVGGCSSQPQSQGNTGNGNDTVYTLIVSSPKNDQAEAPFVEWLHNLEDLSDGRLKFEIHLSSALYQQSELISAMNSGMCDIGVLSLSEESNTFALNSNIISFPFMGMGYSNDFIYETLYEEYPELKAEYDNAGVMLLDYSYNPPFNLHFTTTQPITQPSDLNGLKIVTTSDILASFIAQEGGAPVSQPITEWYNSLEKGVATGLVAHGANILNFGLIELLEQDVIFGEGSGISVNLNGYLWSLESWEKLPDDLQQLILDQVPELHETNNASQMEDAQEADDACVADGNLITVLDNEQITLWREAASDLINEKIREIEASTGAPVQEMYQRALELANQAVEE